MFKKILCIVLAAAALLVPAGCKTQTQTDSNMDEKEEKVIIEAGTDSGLTRDGTPKKYFTLSFDDGITQDAKIIEILKKYDVDCCSFNINTGLFGVSWDWVASAVNYPGLSHLRYTEEEIRTGIYDDYDVCVHTLNHTSLKDYNSDVEKLKEEVQGDADNITAITGVKPVGMAWPGGDGQYTNETIELVLENTDIRFARGTTSTNSFKLPRYFMKWQPTCQATASNLLELAQKFLDAECTSDMLFYVWGHGYELDMCGYDNFEKLVKMMSEAEDVVLVTNSEFYQLFKDEIPSWKES